MAILTNDTDPFLDGSLVLGYNMNGSTSDYTGTSSGTATDITYATAKFSEGSVYNGTSAFFDTNYRLPASSEVAFSVWFSYTDSSGDGMIVSNFESSGANSTDALTFGYRSNAFYYNVANGTSYTSASFGNASTYADGLMHLLVVNVSGTTLEITIDDVVIATITLSYAYTGGLDVANMIFGKTAFGAWFFDGKLDQAMLFNRFLTTTEKTSLFTMEEAVASGIPIFFNGTEVTQVFFNGTELTEAYFNGTLLQ